LVNKYLAENPDEWNHSADKSVLQAVASRFREWIGVRVAGVVECEPVTGD